MTEFSVQSSAMLTADEHTDDRSFLAQFWSEVAQLPPLQRLAMGLTFTDGELACIWLHGIVSIRQIGQTLQLTPEQFNRLWVLLEWNEEQRERARALTNPAEKFALLWQHLPLNDLTIAALLETSQQNVVRLRQAARERLHRRIKRPAPEARLSPSGRQR